jgi:asparagine synthase (glutamine-hydrolysing)
MCGICGYVSFKKPIEEKRGLLQAMNDLMLHRGPDEGALYLEGRVGLGHRRLSIIDLSGGKQPMGNEDGSLTVVFNGEIYNFPELKAELQAKGFSFRTNSDTEVILHGYAAWGDKVLEKMNGMFAFALWDAKRQRLLAARDRLGKKPVYYHLGREGFAFASEMKSILRDPEVPREINSEAVDKYFSYGYIPAPHTIFKAVSKLLPGHSLVLENGNLKVTHYWDVTYRPDADCKNEDDYVEKLHGLMQASVKRRLISDVPLGAFLSGGIDSSVVVGLMAGISNSPVKTFTIGFEEKGYSEAADARAVAKLFNTEHHEFTVHPDAVALLPDLVWHFDEPFADSSAVPTYYVSKMARSQVTVVLSGDGGDELFAGYNRYLEAGALSRYKKIPRVLREKVAAGLAGRLPMGTRGKFFLMALGQIERRENYDLADIYPPIKADLYSSDFEARLQGMDPPEASLRYWTDAPMDALSRMQYLDTKVYLPDDILTKVDRMSMANSLETRAPLLDYTVVEFAASIPPSLQRKDGRGKYILRKMASRFLPPSILDKKKQGFAIPRDQWFQRDLKQYAADLLTSKKFKERGYFDDRNVRMMLDEHVRGQRDYSTWIWCLINFELWHQLFVDADTRRI